MVRLRIASSLALACCGLFSVQCAQGEPRAVIELFTSQGCSSCPPADKLAAEYAHDPSVIVMSLAVDYWDYLGWKDTLALAGHTSRQRAYAKVRGDRQVYTPQAVIDGAVHALGSDKAAIEKAIRQTREQSAPLTLPVKIERTGDKLTVTVPASADEKEARPRCGSARSPSRFRSRSAAARTAGIRSPTPTWCGAGSSSATGPAKPRSFDVPLKDFQNGQIDSAAVLVQSGVASAPKLMLGAAQTSIQ